MTRSRLFVICVLGILGLVPILGYVVWERRQRDAQEGTPAQRAELASLLEGAKARVDENERARIAAQAKLRDASLPELSACPKPVPREAPHDGTRSPTAERIYREAALLPYSGVPFADRLGRARALAAEPLPPELVRVEGAQYVWSPETKTFICGSKRMDR